MMMFPLRLAALFGAVAAQSTCGELRSAFRESTCCPTLGGTSDKETNYSLKTNALSMATPVPQLPFLRAELSEENLNAAQYFDATA